MLGSALSDAAGNVGRPGDFRQFIQFRDLGRESAAPGLLVDQIKRTGVGRGVMIRDEAASQAVNQEGGRIEKLVGAGVGFPVLCRRQRCLDNASAASPAPSIGESEG